MKAVRKPRTKNVTTMEVCAECERCVTCGAKAEAHLRHPGQSTGSYWTITNPSVTTTNTLPNLIPCGNFTASEAINAQVDGN